METTLNRIVEHVIECVHDNLCMPPSMTEIVMLVDYRREWVKANDGGLIGYHDPAWFPEVFRIDNRLEEMIQEPLSDDELVDNLTDSQNPLLNINRKWFDDSTPAEQEATAQKFSEASQLLENPKQQAEKRKKEQRDTIPKRRRLLDFDGEG